VIRYCEIEQVDMPSALLALRLLLLTGCRRNEILELQWQWIDFEQGKIDFPDSKTGKKSVYLNPPTLELLENVEKVKGNPFVCTGRGGEGRLINLQKPWSRIRRRAECFRLIELIAEHEGWSEAQIEQARKDTASDAAAKLTSYRAICKKLKITLSDNTMNDVRLHDLRHSFASMGAAGGLSLFMIGKLLGHSQSQTTERYAHLLGEPMKEATNMIGNRIWAAMEGKQAQVLEISQKKPR
jgi:integrase